MPIRFPFHHSIKRWTLLVLLCWSTACVFFGGLNIVLIRQSVRDQVHTKAWEAFNKDQSFRYWATMHGGVYVPQNEATPPNPYLAHIPERDISTPDGQKLTLMNPAYMVRQLNDTYGPLYGVQGHITSLNPIRPQNVASPWEAKALKAFEHGVKELYEIVPGPDGGTAWLMRPMVTTAGCLKCHAHQGYKEGDIRGGVSVRVPMGPFVEASRGQILASTVMGGLMWALGACIILLGAMLVARNIRDREDMAQALSRAKNAADEASKTKTEFLANMSHEIRTPLNGLMGMLQLMRSSRLDKDQAEYVGMAMQSSNRLNRLLADILDISRVEAGKLTLVEAPFCLRTVLEEVAGMFRFQAEESGVDLNLEVDPAVPAVLRGDASRLQQICINLVGNAFKYTGKGHVSLTANALHHTDETVRVLLCVNDTGIGISDDRLASLFQPFSQGMPVSGRLPQGAGLGLAICNRLVDLMGGNMAVESTPGKGTTFYVSLPLATGHGEMPKVSVPDDGQPVTVPPMRILLVEDERINRMAAVRLLSKNGHEVAQAENGQEAIDLLRRNDYDVVLMDVQMPVMNGIEAVAAIREGRAGEDKRNIPVIALTAYAMSGDREKLLAAGMDDYVSKPVDTQTLRSVLLWVVQKGGAKKI